MLRGSVTRYYTSSTPVIFHTVKKTMTATYVEDKTLLENRNATHGSQALRTSPQMKT